MHRFLFPFKLPGNSLHVYTSLVSLFFSYNLSFFTWWCSFVSLPDTCKNCCQNCMMLLPVQIRFLVPRNCMTAVWFVISINQLCCKDSPGSSADWKDSPFPSPVRRQWLRWNQIRCLLPRGASLCSEAPSYVIPSFTHRDAEAMVFVGFFVSSTIRYGYRNEVEEMEECISNRRKLMQPEQKSQRWYLQPTCGTISSIVQHPVMLQSNCFFW